mgnify:FL=1|tara:strand:- start:2197 stop:2775 length:579 start_codon:yes stop_codon:yes gene_type:complete
MAKNISEVGIVTGQVVKDTHVLQLTDALRGDDAYNLHLSGNIQINTNFYPTGSGTAGQSLISDGLGNISFGAPTSTTASYVTSSNVDGPFGFDSVQTASYALTASYTTLISASYALTASHVTGLSNSRSVLPLDGLSSNYVISHNLSEKLIVLSAYDSLFEQVIPTKVKLVDENTVQVQFSKNFAGSVVVVK